MERETPNGFSPNARGHVSGANAKTRRCETNSCWNNINENSKSSQKYYYKNITTTFD